MHIESGTTGERRTRLAIFLGMCVVFGGWFGYDGLWGYPAKNLRGAIQQMNPKPLNPRTNPKVTKSNLHRVAEGMAVADVEALLGQPILVTDRELTFCGPRLSAVLRIADDKLTQITTRPAAEGAKPSFRVTESQLQRITAGMSESELTRMLGEPSEVQPKKLWYVGPAAHAEIPIAAGRVSGQPAIVVNKEPSEADIFIQKLLAVGLGVVSIGVLLKFVRVLRTRAILDDTGFTLNSRHVPWEAITGLDIDDYKDKGWVNLEYEDRGSSRTLRVDSYHLGRFNEIVSAICEKKGFASPLAKSL